MFSLEDGRMWLDFMFCVSTEMHVSSGLGFGCT